MSVYFEEAEKLMGKGDKITPEEVDHMKTLEALADDDEAKKISWLLEGVYQTVGTDPKFNSVL